jgi:hypothetical protein
MYVQGGEVPKRQVCSDPKPLGNCLKRTADLCDLPIREGRLTPADVFEQLVF